MSELGVTSAESKLTYKEIQEYVQNKYDLHVPSLYIAQAKCKTIIDALRYFQMIE